MKLYNLKNVAKILLCGSILLGPTSCSDFLDEQDPSNLTPESFYTIPDHAEAAVAATYAGLRFYGEGAGIFSANWQMLEAVTGTATTETGQNSDLNNLYSLTYDGNTGHIATGGMACTVCCQREPGDWKRSRAFLSLLLRPKLKNQIAR
jgi:hypothetical protein